MVCKAEGGPRDGWTLEGKVVSGARQASFFTQLVWVQAQCMTKLGFKPYPGTLNLEVREEFTEVLAALRNANGIMLIPPDLSCCTGRALPVSVQGVCGALILPAEDVNIHGKNVLEVMAPVRLKDVLGLKDGDTVTLRIRSPGD